MKYTRFPLMNFLFNPKRQKEKSLYLLVDFGGDCTLALFAELSTLHKSRVSNETFIRGILASAFHSCSAWISVAGMDIRKDTDTYA